MTFDSNRAWKQATAAIAANREVLMALAGVFFLLPGLAVSLLLPQPEPAAGADADAIINQMRAYYMASMPFLIPVAVLQAGGTLTMLTLFADRSRPTVGQAIRQGFVSVVPYVLAQLVIGLGLGLAGSVLLTAAALTGAGALVSVVMAVLVAALAYIVVRTSLAAPVIAVEGVRNPMQALRRSWRLTHGQAGRLGLFYLLLAVAFFFLISVVMAVLGIVLVLVAGPETGRFAAAVVSSALGAIAMIYFVGVLAAVHRQLGGANEEPAGATFD